MHIKSKLKELLGKLVKKVPVNNNKDIIFNGQLIKNHVFDLDEALKLNSITKATACYIKVLATDKENAYEIQNLISKNKDELNVEAVFVENKSDYKIRNKFKKQQSELMHNNSVIIKLNPKSVFESVLSITKNNFHAINNIVLDYDNQHDCNELKCNKKIVIDFSSPNIAKPFHYGHLKSTILGNYLANLYKFLGHNVTKLNYIGDWGTQYGLLSLGLDEHDDNNKNDKSLISIENGTTSALRHLLDVYVQSNERGRLDENFFSEAKRRFLEMNKDVNSSQYKRWKTIRDISLKELKASYDKLGVSFDVFEYESDYANSSIELVKEMMNKNIVHQLENGVTVAKVEKNNRLLDINLLKSDGASLYLTRDIIAAISRKNRFNFDKMLYIVGIDQERHFYSLKEIVKQLDHNWADSLIHVKMGKVLGMSSRLGNVILLSDIIEEATNQFIKSTKDTPTSKINYNNLKDLEEVGRQLALSALFVFDMKQPRTVHYEFDWSLVMLNNNKSGINLQTTFARLSSLLRKSSLAGIEPLESTADSQFDFDSINCEEAINLINNLDEFDLALHSSYWFMDPYYLVNHAIRLCKSINKARRSENLWILGENDKRIAQTRLSLFYCSHKQLELILKLIGLKPLYKV